LIQNGPLNSDKGVHILYSSWVACREDGLETFTHPDSLDTDVQEMLTAYIRYPGSPRFEQLSAIVNALVNGKYDSVASSGELGLPVELEMSYDSVKSKYNTLYSSLNDAAAERHWRPYATVKRFLSAAADVFDLHIASGVTQDILERDLERHSFDDSLFLSVQGGDSSGGNDKGTILCSFKSLGYEKILFIADSNKDLEYAEFAGVNFYRIQSDDDYKRLFETLPEFPDDQRDAWGFSERELDFFKFKTFELLRTYVSGEHLSPEEITDFINEPVGKV
ncbi:MAG: hypothetical protein KAG97_13395, partial [Victivallales bacterium]|nr:hypothetical protein [Victivallales bacterium]